MTEQTLPNNINLAIIGAGPQALTLIIHLLHKRPQFRRQVLVFDPSGTWLHQWRHQFVAQDIPHLILNPPYKTYFWDKQGAGSREQGESNSITGFC